MKKKFVLESEVKRKSMVLVTQHDAIYKYNLQTGVNTNRE